MGNKKLVYFGIAFAENKQVYFPGNMVIGQLTAQLIKPMKMKAIQLMFVGQAHVFWTETRTVSYGETQHTETIIYTANETLFENTLVLQGEGSSTNQEKVLSQGQHTFPFQFQLPSLLPTSFEGEVGYIRYFVKGVINRGKKSDLNTTAIFTVLDQLDLNTIPDILSPSGRSDSKNLCCWCCSSGPIEVEFYADRSGYVPGEWIMMNATITNSSNSKVRSTSAKLLQFVEFHAVGKTYCSNKAVAKVTGPGCDKNSSVTWNNEKIRVPPLPPSECKHCKIIDISYAIEFKVHLRTCAVDLTSIACVTIGTIPLNNFPMYSDPSVTAMPAPSTLMTSAPPEELVLAPSMLSPPTTEPPTYSSGPPLLCFTESNQVPVQLTQDNLTNGDLSYVPQYTYYNWNQPPYPVNT